MLSNSIYCLRQHNEDNLHLLFGNNGTADALFAANIEGGGRYVNIDRTYSTFMCIICVSPAAGHN